METRSTSSGKSAPGINYKDLNEYGLPALSATGDKQHTDRNATAVAIPKTPISLGRGTRVNNSAVSTPVPDQSQQRQMSSKSLDEPEAESDSSEDEDLVALRKKLDTAKRDLRQKRKEAEKLKLQEELSRSHRE